MKSTFTKILAGVACAILVTGIVAVAGTTVTNRGEVIVVTTYDDLVAATRDTNLATLVSAPMNTLLDRNDADLTAADAAEFTAEGPGQLLVSLAATGSTKIVYVSNGWGTNDWVLLK